MVRLSLALVTAALLQISTPTPMALSINFPTGLSTSSNDLPAPTSLPKFVPEDTQKGVLAPGTGSDAQRSHLAGLPVALRWFRWLPFENINL